MSTTQWTDEFLAAMRGNGDMATDGPGFDFDLRIRFILNGFDVRACAADLLAGQNEIIAMARQIADSLPKAGDSAATAIPESNDVNQKIGQLIQWQTNQYVGIGFTTDWFHSQEIMFPLDGARLATMLACKALNNHRLDLAIPAMNCALAFFETLATLLEQQASQPSPKDSNQQRQTNPRLKENVMLFNRFLQVIEAIRESPALFLMDDAFRTEAFQSYPLWFKAPFKPRPCPGWVNEEKMGIGVNLWQEHMMGCLLVLFAHSLPACYLDKKGIPTLYKSERLAKQEFVAQRIYETAFFLRDVMKEGGLSVLTQTSAVELVWLAAAVHKVKPEWTFQLGVFLKPEWTDDQNNTFGPSEVMKIPEVELEYQSLKKAGKMPEEFSATDLGSHAFPNSNSQNPRFPMSFPLNFDWLFKSYLEGAPPPKLDFARGRSLWGPGLLAAVKVRFFHAEMRFFLRPATEGGQSPPVEVPINQEDLAYTLLTFGYIIPLGLEKLGCILSREEKEAFLHLWKLVGHLMGICDQLLTDDWDQAKELYEKIKSRQMAKCPQGEALTNGLCEFVENLLPAWLPFRGAFAPVLIRDQMGADADILFDAPRKAASRNLAVRACWFITKNVLLRSYFLSRYLVFNRIPFARAAIDSQVQSIGNAVIASWRQTYERRPLDLTSSGKGFTANATVGQSEHATREASRKKVFQWAVVGVVLILLVHPIFWLGVVSFVISNFSSASWPGTVATAMFCLCILNVIDITWFERKLLSCLQELKFQPQRQF
ncbi:MAG: DUF2236 domain-containing protein [Verrucomicrobia bacterium]|nr:DUF2236 domain-containing protein [Verrucomicrobiota bacterium]